MRADQGPSFGEQLRSHRVAAHLTQEELADRAGVTAKAIGALERGERQHPYPHTLGLLGTALGLSAAERAALKATVPSRGSPPPLGQAAVQSPLPAAPSPLIGREREVAAVQSRLCSEATRLLTLTGPGGVGKTRLALQVAADLRAAFADGVWWVELAALADPALVLPTISRALGVPEAAGLSLSARLAAALWERRLLLVLDNVEQVLAAAPAVADLLAACPRLAVLATSRARLRAERAFPVPPLELPAPGQRPSPAEVARCGAGRLFAERAQAARPGFALDEGNAAAVAALCRRLDGLPLAIELVAARVRTLAPPAILARLERRLPLPGAGPRDLPARQQTIGATLDWSYDLLDEPGQVLFDRLSVFAGGWTLEAAEAIGAGQGIEAAEVLDLLVGLVEQSLVAADEAPDGAVRYRLLETLRQYGREHLAANGGSAAARDRHATYYLALAEEPYVRRLGGVATMNRRKAEQDNLRAAVRWLVERGDIERALRLAAALQEFWRRGFLTEGAELLTELLSVVAPGTSPLVRAHALAVAGILAQYRGDLRAARAFLEEGLALQQQSGSPRHVAFALGRLGLLAREQGDLAGADALLTESLAIYREQGDAEGIASQLDRLGTVAHARGDADEARRRYAESEAMFRDLDLLGYLAWSLHNQGWLALDQGEVVAARSLLRRALLLFHEQGCGPQSAGSLAALACVAAAGGDSRRALRLEAAATALAEAMGYRLSTMERSALARWLPPARQALGPDAIPIATAGRALSLDEAVAEALEEAA